MKIDEKKPTKWNTNKTGGGRKQKNECLVIRAKVKSFVYDKATKAKGFTGRIMKQMMAVERDREKDIESDRTIYDWLTDWLTDDCNAERV